MNLSFGQIRTSQNPRGNTGGRLPLDETQVPDHPNLAQTVN